MDEREQERRGREQMLRAHKQMQQALETASHLSPLFGVHEKLDCHQCGHVTYIVARYADADVPICLDCAVKEMDEYEAQLGQKES